jgi:hypothetical protein
VPARSSNKNSSSVRGAGADSLNHFCNTISPKVGERLPIYRLALVTSNFTRSVGHLLQVKGESNRLNHSDLHEHFPVKNPLFMNSATMHIASLILACNPISIRNGVRETQICVAANVASSLHDACLSKLGLIIR